MSPLGKQRIGGRIYDTGEARLNVGAIRGSLWTAPAREASRRLTAAFEGAQDDSNENRAKRREDQRADEALGPPEGKFPSEPATDDAADHPHDDGGQAALDAVGSDEPARDGARDEPDEDPTQQVHARIVAGGCTGWQTPGVASYSPITEKCTNRSR